MTERHSAAPSSHGGGVTIRIQRWVSLSLTWLFPLDAAAARRHLVRVRGIAREHQIGGGS